MFCYHPTFKFIQIHKKLSDAVENGSDLYRLKTEDNLEIRKIFAKCLDKNMTIHEINYVFSVYGEIENVELKVKKNQESKGRKSRKSTDKIYCFVTFKEPTAATSFWILDLPHYVYNRLAIHSHLVYCSVGLGGMFHFESWVSNLDYEDLRVLVNRKQLSEYFEIDPADSWHQPAYKAAQQSDPLAVEHNKSSSIMRLNDDCFFKIFSHLDMHGIISLKNVCKRFSELVLDQLKITKCLDFEGIKGNSKLTLMELRNVLMNVGCYLRELRVNSCKFNSNNNDRILEMIPKHCRNLKVLHLNGFKLSKFSRNLKKLTHKLEILNMSDSSELTDDFFKSPRRNFEIKILNLSNNNLLSGKFISNFQQLESLNVSNCRNICGKHLKEIFMAKKLRELDVSNCNNLNGNDLNEILLNFGQHLEKIHLNNIYADSNGIIVPNISKLVNLKRLEICNVHCPQEDQLLTTLDTSNCENLEELLIPYGNLTISTLNVLMQLKNLKILNLSYKRSVLTENDEKLLNCLYENNCSLEELHMADTTFASTTVLGAVLLLDKLRMLDISKCFGINNDFLKEMLLDLMDKKDSKKLTVNVGQTDVDVNILKEPVYRQNKHLLGLNWKVNNDVEEHDYDIDESQTGCQGSQPHESFNLDDIINMMSSIEDCDQQLIALIKQKLLLDRLD